MKQLLLLFWIVPASLLITFIHSCWALIGSLFPGACFARTNRVIRCWSASLLRLIRLKYQTFNPYHVDFNDGKQYIVMCNHTSVYDIPLSIIALDASVRMVAKKELSRIPIFGHAMQRNDFVFIDRKNRHQAIKDLEAAAEKMRQGIVVWIAPEGTRSRDGKLLPFKKGGFMMALQTGATIVPVGIRGAHEIAASKSLKVKMGLQAEVHIGKPIDTTEYKSAQREELMERVKLEIAEAAGLRA
tara:strand:+ start:26060 stop:26788 length:729 start_codon:yes stop_codon:yes gene_type:complete